MAANTTNDDDSVSIEFLCEPSLEGKIPAPDKSVRFVADWFKNLGRDMGMPNPQGLAGFSAKACLPMTDAFSLGYTLPLPFEIYINVPADLISLQWKCAEDVPFKLIEQHHPGQVGAPNPPFHLLRPLKFINPWRIKVPDGYSVLFVQPLNHFQLPFECFSALVDCDRFHTTINLPFIWTAGPGEFILPAGTPIAQLIPIKRESLIKNHIARTSTDSELEQQKHATEKKYGEESAYAKQWRVKK